ncbi:hypothetical protein XPA_009198 [Xanthoria parietina]
MVGKMKEAHVKAVELSAAVLEKHVSDKFEGKTWCVNDSEPTLDAMYDTYQGTAGWGDLATYNSGAIYDWTRYFYVTPITTLVAKTWDVCVRRGLKLTVETTISFKAVSDTGDFRVESKTRTTRNEY